MDSGAACLGVGPFVGKWYSDTPPPGTRTKLPAMSAYQGSALTAVALQLHGALDAYRKAAGQMVPAGRLDLALYQQLGELMDRMRLYATALPRLSLPWVELLIRHFEFTQGLWNAQRGELAPQELQALHAGTLAAAGHLQECCARALQEMDLQAG